MDLKWSANRKDRKISPAELGGKGIEIVAQIFHESSHYSGPRNGSINVRLVPWLLLMPTEPPTPALNIPAHDSNNSSNGNPLNLA